MASFIKGETIILSVWDESDSYDPIACLTSNSLNETKNIIESQTKCSAGQIVKTPGSYTYDISLEGEMIVPGADQTTYAPLREKLVAGDLVEWKISTYNGSESLYGSGYLTNVTLDAAAGDEIATFSAELVGDGETAITTVAPNP